MTAKANPACLGAEGTLDGTSSPLGEMQGWKPVAMIGMSHFRFGDGGIVEEWTVFDEVAVLAQAYRA